MAYSHSSDRSDNRRGATRSSSSSRPYANGGVQMPGQEVYHGPRGTATRGGGSGSRRGSGRRGSGRDRQQGGYPLKARQINFQGRRGPRFDTRLLLVGAAALVVVIIVVLVVKGCSSSASSDTGTDNAYDSRVADGASEELTLELADALDQAELLETVALAADQYDDPAIVELALEEPTALELAAALVSEDGWSAQTYGGTVSQGSAPELYCWDVRWGGTEYAGTYLALTGSGPTALSMAVMGLTGTVTNTPSVVADLVTAAGYATGDSYMSGEYLTGDLSALSVSCSTYVSSADNISAVLDSGVYILIEVEAGTLTDEAHWVLLVDENSDGTIVVYDPTSTTVSAHPWSTSTLANACDTLYALTYSETTTEETTE